MRFTNPRNSRPSWVKLTWLADAHLMFLRDPFGMAHQAMFGMVMTKEPLGDGEETRPAATGVPKADHLDDVHQLVLHDPHQGVQTIRAEMARHVYVARPITEGVEEKRRGDADLKMRLARRLCA